MYHPQDIVELLRDNLRKTGNPFGLATQRINTWWKDAGLPEQGEYHLFSGLMYQMLPYIEVATDQMGKWENTRLADYLSWLRYVPKSLAGLGLNIMTPGQEKKRYQQTLTSISWLLQHSGVDIAYQPEADFYSGILLYDLGDVDGFIQHAENVLQGLRAKGISRVITVDPHTTYALKVLYPHYLGSTLEVTAYFQHLRLKGNGQTKDMTIHDSCFYSRFLQISDVPRQVLAEVGVRTSDLRSNGSFTHCCGGPAESVSPSLAQEVGDHRANQLKENGGPIVSMCPICFANLRKHGAEVHDLASVLASHAE
jgi:Fe-S oxidoreductase